MSDSALEKELVQRAQGGDREAFAQLVSAHQAVVFGYLRARLTQASDADDLTQETFLRCYQAQARFDTQSQFRPWLLGIARNLLREHLRRHRRRKEVAWTELCLELEELLRQTRDDHDEVLGRLPQCLSGLGPSAREAIEMHYGQKLRLSEIGLRQRRSEGAVKLLMYRARQALKNCLDRMRGGPVHD